MTPKVPQALGRRGGHLTSKGKAILIPNSISQLGVITVEIKNTKHYTSTEPNEPCSWLPVQIFVLRYKKYQFLSFFAKTFFLLPGIF
jgi:hypothetical protein